jgi:hypothetical protein
LIYADTVPNEEQMSTKTAHQETSQFVKVVRERNREAIQRAERREAELDAAARRSARVLAAARKKLRASGVIR